MPECPPARFSSSLVNRHPGSEHLLPGEKHLIRPIELFFIKPKHRSRVILSSLVVTKISNGVVRTIHLNLERYHIP